MTSRDDARGGGLGILAISGSLPIAVAAVNLASGVYIAAGLLVTTILLHLVYILAGRFLKGNQLRFAFLLSGTAITALLKAGIMVIDPANGHGSLIAIDMILFCSLMRTNAEGWTEDLKRRAWVSPGRLKAPALAALFIICAAFLRDVLASGGIALPFMDGERIRLPVFSDLPLKQLASPSGLLLIAGFAAAGLKALSSAMRGRKA